MKIVMVSGYIGSGKTTFSKFMKDFLNKKGYYTEIFSFADEVKRIAREEFMWDGKKDEKGRKLLQVIGTEAGREYNEDIWVLKLKNKIDSLPVKPAIIIIDDWRFPNEYEILSSYYEIYPVRIVGKSSTSNHISEHALDLFSNYLLVVFNTYTDPHRDFISPVEDFSNKFLMDDYWETLDNSKK